MDGNSNRVERLFEKYPQLNSLRGLVTDAVIDKEIGSHVQQFEVWHSVAKGLIPTVNLNRIFPADLERGAIHLDNFLGHWGNVSVEELCKICLIVKWLKPKRILEIGTYNGLTTLQMALNAPDDCITYTLNLKPGEQIESGQLNELDALVSNKFMAGFGSSIGKYFANRPDLQIEQLWGDSATFDYSVIDGTLDLIFVDAAHDYKRKRIDTENAFKCLSKNGVILWHNYADVTCPEVTRCLIEYAREYQIWHLRNTSLAVFNAGYRLTE